MAGASQPAIAMVNNAIFKVRKRSIIFHLLMYLFYQKHFIYSYYLLSAEMELPLVFISIAI